MDLLKKLSISDNDNSTSGSDRTSDAAHEEGGHGHGLLHKLTDVLKEEVQPHSAPAQAPKHDGLLGNFGEVVGHVTKDNTPQKPHTLGDKINNMLGGGAKGEAKEDGLDKAIDFVQEHLLKEGQQKNESAIEQLKDEQIANALRNGFKSATGKEFPSLDLFGHKKDNE